MNYGLPADTRHKTQRLPRLKRHHDLRQPDVPGWGGAAVAYALERGVNFIDTAEIYPPTKPNAREPIAGSAIR